MKPILFNTEMVRAIQNDLKTVTRRIIKPQPVLIGRFWELGGAMWADTISTLQPMPAHSLWNRMPYKPDDILYVRETFGIHPNGKYCYRADYIGASGWRGWRSSIHMPKEAARLFLRVTGVRVERIHEISNQDVIREGVNPRWINGGCHCTAYQDGCLDEPCPNRDAYEWSCHVTPFSEVWDSTIPKKDRDRYGWDANPWVWVIEFERISKEKALNEKRDA